MSKTTWMRGAVSIACLAIATSVVSTAQTTTMARTPWGDPDLQGEWTSEGEFGVPMERPAQYGTRAFLTDAEYAERIAQARARDERDLQPVDVLSDRVDMPNAPIPHWREQGTTSRRTSLIIDPANGRLPPRAPQAKPPQRQTCGSLQRGEPCDSYTDYGLGVRCIVHGSGYPSAMFPAVYNANMRITQSPGYLAISYELIHDTRVIPLDHRPPVSPNIRMYMGDARAHWDGATLVIESANFPANGSYQGASENVRLTERFTRVAEDAMQYQVTVTDLATWTAPWTAALDLKARPANAGVFEYACHEGNYGMRNMLATSRAAERKGEK